MRQVVVATDAQDVKVVQVVQPPAEVQDVKIAV